MVAIYASNPDSGAEGVGPNSDSNVDDRAKQSAANVTKTEEEVKERGEGKDRGGGYGEKPVACACASKWLGDLGGQNAGKEDGGWEVKAVTSLPAHRRAGLVGKCLEAVNVELVRREKEGRAATSKSNEGGAGGKENGKEGEGEGKEEGKRDTLKVWVHAVEEYNGDYWRRRGWRYVRGYDLPAGHFISPGAPTGFRLAVLIKEVDVL